MRVGPRSEGGLWVHLRARKEQSLVPNKAEVFRMWDD